MESLGMQSGMFPHSILYQAGQAENRLSPVLCIHNIVWVHFDCKIFIRQLL
jgi:hypothetical protein